MDFKDRINRIGYLRSIWILGLCLFFIIASILELVNRFTLSEESGIIQGYEFLKIKEDQQKGKDEYNLNLKIEGKYFHYLGKIDKKYVKKINHFSEGKEIELLHDRGNIKFLKYNDVILIGNRLATNTLLLVILISLIISIFLIYYLFSKYKIDYLNKKK